MPSPTPLSRSALVAALNARRDNDVYARIPCETGGYIRCAVVDVVYDGEYDTIDIVTDVYLDGEDDPDEELPPSPQHVTLIDDGSGDPPSVVHGDAPLSPEGETAMRALVAAAKADLQADPSIGERQEAAIKRIRENAGLSGGVEAQQAQGDGETP
ncbi:hypothetical protein K1W54_05000 [Micromonospora sp. CPCC 205371]|nr:hypothetical protein [Micromonospora sp. CPCC 205371]